MSDAARPTRRAAAPEGDAPVEADTAASDDDGEDLEEVFEADAAPTGDGEVDITAWEEQTRATLTPLFFGVAAAPPQPQPHASVDDAMRFAKSSVDRLRLPALGQLADMANTEIYESKTAIHRMIDHGLTPVVTSYLSSEYDANPPLQRRALKLLHSIAVNTQSERVGSALWDLPLLKGLVRQACHAAVSSEYDANPPLQRRALKLSLSIATHTQFDDRVSSALWDLPLLKGLVRQACHAAAVDAVLAMKALHSVLHGCSLRSGVEAQFLYWANSDESGVLPALVKIAADREKPMAAAVLAANTVNDLHVHHSACDVDTATPMLPVLKDALQHPKHADGAMRAIDSIARNFGPDLLVNEGVIGDIAACIAANPAPRVKASAWSALRQLCDAGEAIKWSVVRAGVLQHLDPAVTSIVWPAAAGFLLALLDGDDNGELRLRHVLDGAPNVVPALLQGINDPDCDTRDDRAECFEIMVVVAARDAECSRLILHQAGFDADGGPVSTPEAQRVRELAARVLPTTIQREADDSAAGADITSPLDARIATPRYAAAAQVAARVSSASTCFKVVVCAFTLFVAAWASCVDHTRGSSTIVARPADPQPHHPAPISSTSTSLPGTVRGLQRFARPVAVPSPLPFSQR
eukprot:CAMPEP_0174880008 /NCGR_PEP_ID=MMETSP1114-20130205/83547_1 /TAXON_ID=312471 /ORGANISM="Neobodo designis, Strain CCAP 1951/1" /LENGTH=637 /DNA_ID=CAMNT_0016115403 /DNA_START=62 /DNA_END=1972 /DNA_ORIENTATION=-